MINNFPLVHHSNISPGGFLLPKETQIILKNSEEDAEKISGLTFSSSLYMPTQKWPPGPQIAINYDISWLQGAHLGLDPSLLLNIQQLPLFTSKAAASRGGFQEGNYTAR